MQTRKDLCINTKSVLVLTTESVVVTSSESSLTPASSVSSVAEATVVVSLVEAASTTVVVVTAPPAVAKPSVAGNAKRLLIELLLRPPIIPNHLPLATLQRLATNAVEETFLFVVVYFFILVLGKNFTVFGFNHSIFGRNLNVLISVDNFTGFTFDCILNFGFAQFAQNALERLVGLLEVIVIVELQRLLLARLRSAWLEAIARATLAATTAPNRLVVDWGAAVMLAAVVTTAPHGPGPAATMEPDRLAGGRSASPRRLGSPTGLGVLPRPAHTNIVLSLKHVAFSAINIESSNPP